MFAPVSWLESSWSWSWSVSRSRSGSRSVSRSVSGSRSWPGSRSWSWPWSGSVLPPSVLLAFSSHPHPVGALARSAFYGGGIVEPFLDAVAEAEPVFDIEVGKAYYLETFGKFYVGKVVSLTGTALTLDSAAWVASTGPYHEFLANGKTSNMEVEPMGDGVQLPLAYLAMVRPWAHKLFKEAV